MADDPLEPRRPIGVTRGLIRHRDKAHVGSIWLNLMLASVRERSAVLDGLLREAGRSPGDVRRTMNAWVV